VKDRYYDAIDDDAEYTAPWLSYDKDLDFNEEIETEYEQETDASWAGEEPSDDYDDEEDQQNHRQME